MLDELEWVIICREGIPNGAELFGLNYMLIASDHEDEEFELNPCEVLVEESFHAKFILIGATRKEQVRKNDARRSLTQGILLYYYSHLEDVFVDNEYPPDDTCNHCSGKFNSARRERIRGKIGRGLQLSDLRHPLDVKEVLSSHLTIEDVSKILGKKMNEGHQNDYLRETAESLDFESMCREMVKDVLTP